MAPEIGRTRSGLRLGYTTGSCAAAAAKAAAQMLFSETEVRHVRLMTPKGIELYLDVEETERTSGYVQCAVRKYSGDDPDVTDGLLIFARVEKGSPGGNSPAVLLDGGVGVGRVTRPGLEQKVGQAAINRVPRRMIREAVREICGQYGFCGTVEVTIFIPDGEKTAEKTMNSRLGIEGGLSVLGTTGIVEPMSEKALTDTIYLEMKMLKDEGRRCCCAVPGNYGSDFLRDGLGLDAGQAVKCSNYIGETIDDAKYLGMSGLLLIGHIGKFVKLAAGVMNTHSAQADCRMEVLSAHAAMAGADPDTVRRIMECINTSQAVGILKERHLLEPVMETVGERIGFYLKQRAGSGLTIGALVFSESEGILIRAAEAEKLLPLIRKEQEERKVQEGQKDQKKKTEEGAGRA